ncbi:MAG: RNA-directed DNA polymerase [Chryseobacterium sp.]|nr:MAG: RNA-directed DNA polymerase [Chryseobacterium sp.]
MTILPDQKDYIQKHFEAMQNKIEFLSLLNYAKSILFGEKGEPFVIRQLNYYINTASKAASYQAFEIKKKNGGTRNILAPNQGLKAIQSCLSLILQEIYIVNAAAKGFVKGRSIVDNASIHIQQYYVFNIDLKDFFSSIDQARVWARLKMAPINLNSSTNRQELSNIIAKLCCHELEVERLNMEGEWEKQKKNVLPQGAPTSPVLSNLICEKLDKRLTGVARRFGLRYSRYADDITFSSLHHVYNNEGDFVREITRIINEQNFHIKETKTRMQGQGYRQEVTGLIVNERVNVPKRYTKELRKWLYLWENYGHDRAYLFFKQSYLNDKIRDNRFKPDMIKILAGKLDFLKMIRGAEDHMYKKLQQRFLALIPKTSSLSKVLDTWEELGIEKAMEEYYAHRTA